MRTTIGMVHRAGGTVVIGARTTMMIPAIFCLTVTMMVSDVGLTTAVLVAATGRDHIPVLPSIQIWKLFNKRYHPPDVLVVHTLTPSRHTRCLDSVLDDPECLCRIIVDSSFSQVRRCRIEALAQFGLRCARRQMTSNTHRVVVTRAGSNLGFVIEIWYIDISNTHFN